MQRRKLEDLNLLDDFLFQAMITYPEIGEKFCRLLLQVIMGRKLGSVRVIAQKSYGGRDEEFRGARLDVYVEEIEADELEVSSLFDIEPDNNDDRVSLRDLPKRVRFYHAIIDSRCLKKGENFGKLKRVFIIFICSYDPFDRGRMIYTIRNMCEEDPDMEYDDGARTIFLNTRGTKGNISGELEQLLRYMENTKEENASNDTLKKMQQMVDIVKEDREVTVSYMKGFEIEDRIFNSGRQEGHEEGFQEGMQAGIQQGIQQGIRQGIQQGIQQEQKNTQRERELRLMEKARADRLERKLRRISRRRR